MNFFLTRSPWLTLRSTLVCGFDSSLVMVPDDDPDVRELLLLLVFTWVCVCDQLPELDWLHDLIRADILLRDESGLGSCCSGCSTGSAGCALGQFGSWSQSPPVDSALKLIWTAVDPQLPAASQVSWILRTRSRIWVKNCSTSLSVTAYWERFVLVKKEFDKQERLNLGINKKEL